MTNSTPQFTAAQIAAVLGIKRQSVAWHLREVQPSGSCVVNGNEASAWTYAALPTSLRGRLDAEALQRGYRNAVAMLAAPPVVWPPTDFPKLDDIAPEEIERATKLRQALGTMLYCQHDATLAAAEFEARGVAEYARVFGHAITARHWRTLFKRTLVRAGGEDKLTRLELYLSDKPALKISPHRHVKPASDANLKVISDYLASLQNCAAPSEAEKSGLWNLAIICYLKLTERGITSKRAARQVREYLFAAAPFLAKTRNALRMGFERKLAARLAAPSDPHWNDDGRLNNGKKVEIPEVDILRLRHAAALVNGGRVDETWREQYRHLTEQTRAIYPPSRKAPRLIHNLVNREKVDALVARHHGRRTLRLKIGGVERDWSGVPSMHSFVVDDLTGNLEVALQRGGNTSLIQPQIIAVMDSASGKYVGLAISDDKAPTAELACEALFDAFRRHGVPKELWLENGFVFGKALNINGKMDEQGRTIVAGFAHYGCTIHHHEPGNPRGKAELEKSFDLIQRRMERHPGYTGRCQMLDAPEDFKREQRLIRAGVEATRFRYTFDEGVSVVRSIMQEHNAAAQHGRLQGLSPDQAFELFRDKSDPHMEFTPELEWYLANARYLVTVEAGGVRFTHYGRAARVRGGRLTGLVGEKLWAIVPRRDDSIVTFMREDFTDPFTLEICRRPGARESSVMVSGFGILEAERAKIKEHERAVEDEYQDLIGQFGNPRIDLLKAMREKQSSDSRRLIQVDPALVDSATQMEAQRKELKEAMDDRHRQHQRASRFAQQTGVIVPNPVASDTGDEDAAILRRLAAKHNGGKS